MSFVVKAVGILQQPSTAALLWYDAILIQAYLNVDLIIIGTMEHKLVIWRHLKIVRSDCSLGHNLVRFYFIVSRRLKSVKSIQKITKSMKMVSAAKFAKAERELRAARSYGVSAKGNEKVVDFQ